MCAELAKLRRKCEQPNPEKRKRPEKRSAQCNSAMDTSPRAPTTTAHSSCSEGQCLLKYEALDPSEELCAVSSGVLRDVADPGAALMVDTVQGWVLVGLLSWLDDRAPAGAASSAAVFTDVRALMPWLLETIFKTF
ncbi:hypothetical protein HPB48_006420 [Haemaphysalis longicornis]|uniref:Peptidase S1 domain-containing protein n=1 Tax=Haemaphysalis longicornis TaxID=44386 RepID=A0A9J6FJR3_HAELO|nr:hypothetical protein HPB48_006420 [Haemaphysalis longicornis]